MYYLMYEQKNGSHAYWDGKCLTHFRIRAKEYKEHHHAEAALHRIRKNRNQESFQQLKVDWD